MRRCATATSSMSGSTGAMRRMGSTMRAMWRKCTAASWRFSIGISAGRPLQPERGDDWRLGGGLQPAGSGACLHAMLAWTRAALVVALLACGARAVATAEIPLADFARHDRYRDVKISPDGEYL